MSIFHEFRRWQKDHANIITPKIVELKAVGDVIVELSEGEGMNREILYGVSLFRYQDGTFTNREFLNETGALESKMCSNRAEAKKKMRDVIEALCENEGEEVMTE